MEKSRCNGFLLLDFAVSFLALCLILSAYLQFQERTMADASEAALHYSALRKVSDAASYLAIYSLSGETGSYYETHVISGQKLEALPEIKKKLSEKLGLASLEVYLGEHPPQLPASKNRICITRLVIYSQNPIKLMVCGE